MGELVDHPNRHHAELAAAGLYEAAQLAETATLAAGPLPSSLGEQARADAERLLRESWRREQQGAYRHGYVDGLADRRPPALVAWQPRRRRAGSAARWAELQRLAWVLTPLWLLALVALAVALPHLAGR